MKSNKILRPECRISHDYDKQDYNREGTLELYHKALIQCKNDLETATDLLGAIWFYTSKQENNEVGKLILNNIEHFIKNR
jgi:hypothetical protein